MVVYERAPTIKGLDWENLGVLDIKTESGRLWEVVAHGGSAVYILVNAIVNKKANIQPK